MIDSSEAEAWKAVLYGEDGPLLPSVERGDERRNAARTIGNGGHRPASEVKAPQERRSLRGRERESGNCSGSERKKPGGKGGVGRPSKN